MGWNANRGYRGYSMSNRAVSAYEDGEMPLSKWTKNAILDAVAEIDEGKAELLRAVTLKTLKETVLVKSSWHHTSGYFNATDFYSVDADRIEELTADEIKGLVAVKSAKSETKKYRGDIIYLEWGGTRKHPTATEHRLVGVNIEERGAFYIITDDSGKELLRKKIGSNGTKVIDKPF